LPPAPEQLKMTKEERQIVVQTVLNKQETKAKKRGGTKEAMKEIEEKHPEIALKSNFLKDTVQKSSWYQKHKYINQDFIQNIGSLKYVKYFVLKPLFMIVSIVASVLEEAKKADVFFIDGTFSLAESDLIVTVFSCLINSSIYPVFYLITKELGNNVYTMFFNFVTTFVWPDFSPRFILSDFETAYRSTIRTLFPSCFWYGDFWHFLKAVHEKLVKLGLGKYWPNAKGFLDQMI